MAKKESEKKRPVNEVARKKMKQVGLEMTLQAIPGSIVVNNNLRAKSNIDMIRRRLLGYSVSNKGRRRDPFLEYMGARYLNEDGVDCVPSHGIKLSFCSALQFYKDIDLTQAAAKRILHVNVGQALTPIRFKPTKGKPAIVFENTWGKLAEIADDQEEEEEFKKANEKRKKKGKKKKVPEPDILYQCEIGDELPDFREDIVRLQGGAKAPDLRYRPAFKDWELDIVVRFPPELISQTALVNIISLAGETIGLCEWRPEKGGDWGMYRIKS